MTLTAHHEGTATGTDSSLASGLDALLHRAAFAPIDRIGWIRIAGSDRVRWLNGMVTNSIQTLQPGEGCYNFFLNAQGRIQGDCTAWMQDDCILLETAADRIPALMTMLDRFVIMDDVELTDISSTRSGIELAGPETGAILESIGIVGAPTPVPSLSHISWARTGIDLIHRDSPLVQRFELWAEDHAGLQALIAAVASAGAVLVSPESLETLRILEGTPLYGTDIHEKELPQETGQTRALHFSKGCYLGQEIVERIRSRGNVHRTFSGFELLGELPARGTALEAEGKPVGEITSAVEIPFASSTVMLALGYIRREALDRALPVSYPGGIVRPVSLPYHLP